MIDATNNKQTNLDPAPPNNHRESYPDANASTELEETAKDNAAEFLALNLRPPSLDQTNFLRKTFGLEQLKPLQWRVIKSIMEEKRDQVIRYKLNIMMNNSDHCPGGGDGNGLWQVSLFPVSSGFLGRDRPRHLTPHLPYAGQSSFATFLSSCLANLNTSCRV